MEDPRKFYPPVEVVENIRRQLLDHLQLDPAQLPSREWIALLAAATFRSAATCQESAMFATSFLGLTAQEGDPTKSYTRRTPDGGVVQLKSEDVLILRGVTVCGKPTRFTDVKISERVRSSCDGCGGKAHCVTEVLDPDMRDMLVSYCNYCMLHHTHPKVYDQGSHNRCQLCPVLSCVHHPDRDASAQPKQLPAYSH